MFMQRTRRAELLQRQRQLLQRSAELRVTLGQQAQVLRSPMALADQVRAGAQWLRTHPVWRLLPIVVVALVRPRRSLRWASRLWKVWSLYKQGRRWLLSTIQPDSRAGQIAGAGPSGRS
jgi:hypothetical protein